MTEKENQSGEAGLPMDREYGADENLEAHSPFIKIVGYALIAHTLGLLASIAVYQQYADVEGVQTVMLTSGMIFAIGILPTIGSYFIFRSVIAMTSESIVMMKAAGDDEEGAAMADDKNAEAMRRGKNAFKLLSFSGVCFVASTLVGISGLLSI